MNYVELSFEELLDVCPPTLKDALERYNKGEKLYKKTGEWSHLESPYCEVQSEINVCEVSGEISHALATFLRRKYIY